MATPEHGIPESDICLAARGTVVLHGEGARTLVARIIGEYDAKGEVEQARAWCTVSRAVEALLAEHNRPARLH